VILTWYRKNLLLLRHRLQWHQLPLQLQLLRHAPLLPRPQLRRPVLLAKK
jgi:hypothetical protein